MPKTFRKKDYFITFIIVLIFSILNIVGPLTTSKLFSSVVLSIVVSLIVSIVIGTVTNLLFKHK